MKRFIVSCFLCACLFMLVSCVTETERVRSFGTTTTETTKAALASNATPDPQSPDYKPAGGPY